MSVEPQFLERLQFGVMQRISHTLLAGTDVDVIADIVSDDMCARMMTLVYGRKGVTAIEERSYVEAQFPRWIPRQLQKRWTRKRTVRIDATPLLLFPDASFVPPDRFGPIVFAVDKQVSMR